MDDIMKKCWPQNEVSTSILAINCIVHPIIATYKDWEDNDEQNFLNTKTAKKYTVKGFFNINIQQKKISIDIENWKQCKMPNILAKL